MKALEERRATREYSDNAMSLQYLSGELWAANGVNSVKYMKHTAPTAMNWQEIDVYVIPGKGIYRYLPCLRRFRYGMCVRASIDKEKL